MASASSPELHAQRSGEGGMRRPALRPHSAGSLARGASGSPVREAHSDAHPVRKGEAGWLL